MPSERRGHGAGGSADLDVLLRSMEPELRPGQFVFVSVRSPLDVDAMAMVREAEGPTYVVHRHVADARSLPYGFVGAWITLTVHSSLAAVGLTAVVASVLAEAGISCNVLAGTFHDHLLVPEDRAAEAMALLRGLRHRGQGGAATAPEAGPPA